MISPGEWRAVFRRLHELAEESVRKNGSEHSYDLVFDGVLFVEKLAREATGGHPPAI